MEANQHTSTCPNLIAICSLTHQPCRHCTVDGKCDEAACVNEAVPTFEDLVDIYVAATSPSARRMKGIISTVNNLIRQIGANLGDKAIITAEQYAEIKPFIGAPDEFVIPRFENRIGRNGLTTHGEYVGHHSTLRHYTIQFMRSLGVTDKKAAYALRKDCSATTIANEGIVREAQKLGHTPKVALTSYVDFANLEIKKGSR